MSRIRFILITVCMMFVCSGILFAESLTVLGLGAAPKALTPAEMKEVQSMVVESLQDLNEFVNTVYVKPETIEKWANARISDINATNTNAVVKTGKKATPPKLIPPVSIKALNATLFKSIAPYMKLDSLLQVNFTYTASKTGPGALTISFNLQNNGSAKAQTASVIISQAIITNRAALSKLVKESLVSLYGLWNRYYYVPVKTGVITFTVTPKNSEIVIKSLNKSLLNGKNVGLPIGTYAAVITASNFNKVITNIEINEKGLNYKINLSKTVMKTNAVEQIPVANLYLDCDFTGAKFLVVEDNFSGKTPMLITNLGAGDKTIIFDDAPEYEFKTVKLTLKENDTGYEMVQLNKKGSGFKLTSGSEGALVIVDRQIAGTVSNGTFVYSGTPGIHGLTLIKDRYQAFRTNITLTASAMTAVSSDIVMKKTVGYIATPQASGIDIYKEGKKAGITPQVFYDFASDNLALSFVATNMGFNNLTTNVAWQWGSENNVTPVLVPLFGDIKLVTDPSDVFVTLGGVNRGKSPTNGFVFYQQSAKVTRIKLDREGYRSIYTNVYIQPNMENLFTFTMKEAPVKAFITTTPVKGLDVYINDEYAGLSGEGVFSLELGKMNIHMKKPGLKSIITNVEFTNKGTVVLNIPTMAGVGEDEFQESLAAQFDQLKRLIDEMDFTNAYSNSVKAVKQIEATDYKVLPAIAELGTNFSERMKWLEAVFQAFDLDKKGDEALTMEETEKAVKLFQEGVKVIDTFRNEDARYFEDLRKSMADKAEAILKKERESSQTDDVKKLITLVNPLVYDGDRLVDKSEYKAASAKYNQAVKLIDDSGLIENERIKEHRDRIMKRLKTANKQSGTRDVWWPKMNRIWDGPSFDFQASAITLDGPGFESSKMNLPVSGKLALNIIPFFGIAFGGMFNVTSSSVSTNGAYPSFAFLVGPIVRVPIIDQIAFYSEYDFALANFVKFNMLENALVNAGFDFKFGALGFKLFYQLGFSSSFQKMNHGVGAGLSFWITEE